MDIECLTREGITLETKRVALCHYEGYLSQLVAKKITIEASTDLGEKYGHFQVLQYFKGGAIKERLGLISPSYSLRPIGAFGNCSVVIGNLRISMLDTLINPITRMRYFESVIFLGFNAVLFGYKTFFEDRAVSLDVFKEILKDAKSVGLQTILYPLWEEGVEKATTLEVKKCLLEIKNSLMNLKQHVDYDVLCWESRMLDGYYRQAFSSEDALSQLERLTLELETVEKVIKQQIIFYLPSHNSEGEKEANWLVQLMNHGGPKTALAFPAIVGNSAWGHPLFHPFFRKMQSILDPSFCAVFPVVGWENSLSLMAVGELLKKIAAMNCLGVGLFFSGTDSFENKESWEKTGVIWSLGQSLFDKRDPIENFSIWSQSLLFDTAISVNIYKEMLKEMELVEGQIRFLENLITEKERENISSNEAKIISELALNRLRLLEMQHKSLKNKNSSLPHSGIFDTLQREAKVVLLRVMQSYNFSLQLS